jgi:hypothetical protein
MREIERTLDEEAQKPLDVLRLCEECRSTTPVT